MRDEIDLNADIGESEAPGTGIDAELLPLVSSANIACGFHAGSPAAMARSIALCRQHGIAAGAHPSYPDREGFGRRDLALAPEEIHHAVLCQIGALAAIASAQEVRLRHVKPHGALYNRAAVERAVADAIARAVRDCDPTLALVGLANSALLDAGRAHGLRVLVEGFADRRYTAAGLLVSRARADALIADPAEAEAQVLRMVRGQGVVAQDGTPVTFAVDTLCIHGDGPHALAFARRLRAALAREGIAVRAPNA